MIEYDAATEEETERRQRSQKRDSSRVSPRDPRKRPVPF